MNRSECGARVTRAWVTGRLSTDEYRRVRRALGAKKDAVKEWGPDFVDSDGSISVDALIAGTRKFSTGEQPDEW